MAKGSDKPKNPQSIRYDLPVSGTGNFASEPNKNAREFFQKMRVDYEKGSTSSINPFDSPDMERSFSSAVQMMKAYMVLNPNNLESSRQWDSFIDGELQKRGITSVKVDISKINSSYEDLGTNELINQANSLKEATVGIVSIKSEAGKYTSQILEQEIGRATKLPENPTKPAFSTPSMQAPAPMPPSPQPDMQSKVTPPPIPNRRNTAPPTTLQSQQKGITPPPIQNRRHTAPAAPTKTAPQTKTSAQQTISYFDPVPQEKKFKAEANNTARHSFQNMRAEYEGNSTTFIKQIERVFDQDPRTNYDKEALSSSLQMMKAYIALNPKDNESSKEWNDFVDAQMSKRNIGSANVELTMFYESAGAGDLAKKADEARKKTAKPGDEEPAIGTVSITLDSDGSYVSKIIKTSKPIVKQQEAEQKPQQTTTVAQDLPKSKAKISKPIKASSKTIEQPITDKTETKTQNTPPPPVPPKPKMSLNNKGITPPPIPPKPENLTRPRSAPPPTPPRPPKLNNNNISYSTMTPEAKGQFNEMVEQYKKQQSTSKESLISTAPEAIQAMKAYMALNPNFQESGYSWFTAVNGRLSELNVGKATVDLNGINKENGLKSKEGIVTFERNKDGDYVNNIHTPHPPSTAKPVAPPPPPNKPIKQDPPPVPPKPKNLTRPKSAPPRLPDKPNKEPEAEKPGFFKRMSIAASNLKANMQESISKSNAAIADKASAAKDAITDLPGKARESISKSNAAISDKASAAKNTITNLPGKARESISKSNAAIADKASAARKSITELPSNIKNKISKAVKGEEPLKISEPTFKVPEEKQTGSPTAMATPSKGQASTKNKGGI